MERKKEKKFRVEQVASVIEVCYLTEPSDVYEFCTFIMGEDINPGNIYEKSNEITNLIKEQYPRMKRTLFLANGDSIPPKRVKQIVAKYQDKFGEYIKIKSKDKEVIKTLNYKKEDK